MSRARIAVFCYMFDSAAVESPPTFGSVSCLVIITLERYVKIVHPVSHRKYFRKWMLHVGVAIPWINGFLTGFLPDVITTRFENGECTVWIWPSVKFMYVVQFFLLIWRFIMAK